MKPNLIKLTSDSLPRDLTEDEWKTNFIVCLFDLIRSRQIKQAEVTQQLKIDDLEFHNAYYSYLNKQWDSGDQIINKWKMKRGL